MIDTQTIRTKILDLAMRGQLTEQLPEDGTAEELFQQIQAEKQTLIKTGKIKKDKQLPVITKDIIPFEIPENWKWVRLGSLLRVISGVSYEKSDITSNGLRILRGGNIQNMDIFLDNSDVFIPLSYMDDEKNIRKGDVIIVASTGSETAIGRAGYVDKDYENTLIGAFLRICRPIISSTSLYIRAIFMGDYYRHHIRNEAKGMNINNVKEEYITHFMVPLPPLVEQQRIVEKTRLIFSVLDTIDNLQLQYFNNQAVLKEKLIYAAIRGKLTEQLPEDGTAEELYQQIQEEKKALIKAGKMKKEKQPLSEIKEEEMPFIIPNNWKWIPLGRLICIESGQGLTASEMKPGKIPVYGGNGITGYNDCGFVQKGIIVIGRVGYYCGSVHITTQESWVTDNAFITTYPENCVDKRFLAHVLRYLKLGQNNNGSAQPVVSGKKIYPLPFPLPPIAEQKRIAAKLDELLSLIDADKKINKASF